MSTDSFRWPDGALDVCARIEDKHENYIAWWDPKRKVYIANWDDGTHEVQAETEAELDQKLTDAETPKRD